VDNSLTLFDLLGVLARRRYLAAERGFSAVDLNHTEARLLTLLNLQKGSITQDELSSLLLVDRSNAGRGLKSLEKRGYIHRQKDGADKRTNLVHITPKGRQAVKAISEIKTAMAHSFFGDLNEDEISDAIQLLRKVVKIEGPRDQ